MIGLRPRAILRRFHFAYFQNLQFVQMYISTSSKNFTANHVQVYLQNLSPGKPVSVKCFSAQISKESKMGMHYSHSGTPLCLLTNLMHQSLQGTPMYFVNFMR